MKQVMQLSLGSLIIGPIMAFTGVLAGLEEIYVTGFIVLVIGIVILSVGYVKRPHIDSEE